MPIVVALALLALRALVATSPSAQMTPVASAADDPPGTRASTARLHVARGGPVILGFQSRELSQLSFSVDGQPRALTGRGVTKERYLLPAGDLLVRFAAAPGARLVWSPVGRRGDPEYITAASIGAPITDLDGVFAVGLLLCIVALVLIVQRRRLALVSREMWLAIAIVSVVALIARLVDLNGHGQTWDEDVNWAAGKNYVQNVLSLDFHARSWGWNFEHPPIMKLLVGVGAHLTDGFTGARVICAMLVALGCGLLVPIGARLYDLRTGIVAGVIAALLPPLVAHGQIVGHEAATVLWWTLGVLFALCVHDGLDPDDPAARKTLIARLAGVGIVIGIATASRFVNGLLGPLCVLVVALRAPERWRRTTITWMPAMVGATLLTFYAVWPRLWLHPIAALTASFEKLKLPHTPEPFLGAISNAPPPYYFVVYLAATLPLGVLVCVLVGAVRSAFDSSRAGVILLGWVSFPLLIAASPVRQDGVRYVLPTVLALCLVAAVGVNELARRLGVSSFRPLLGVLTLYLAITLARIHPYYLDYFGEQVGGTATVQRHGWFETAWWGEGLDRAVTYVNDHAITGDRVDRSCVLPQHLTWFRADLWPTVTTDRRNADWVVEYVSSACPRGPELSLVFEVTAAGAPLARVWRVSAKR